MAKSLALISWLILYILGMDWRRKKGDLFMKLLENKIVGITAGFSGTEISGPKEKEMVGKAQVTLNVLAEWSAKLGV